jgi:ADP-ribose pyrophosphatase YjhB (NUDIX family)
MSDDAVQQKGNFQRIVPEGDERERLVCVDCGFINYENPKIVVGSVVHEDTRSGSKILLCRRAINPRKGFWTLPAGFMEQHETAMAGAMREAMEEATAKIEIEALLAVYSIPRLSQVQLIYRAHLAAPDIAAGPESEEVGLFAFDEIPWKQLAFPSVHWALGHDREVADQTHFPPFVNPPGEFGDLKQAGL